MDYFNGAAKPSTDQYLLASINRDRQISDDEPLDQPNFSDSSPVGMFALAEIKP